MAAHGDRTGSGSGPPTVTLLGRAGCCLCDEARAVLEAVRAELAFELIERDIDADDRLLRAYLDRIPVVLIDEREEFELFVEPADLRARLLAAGCADAASSGRAGRPSAARRSAR